MDEHLKNIFDRIKYELNNLHYRWKIYRQICGTNPYRVDLLNKTSSNVFVEFQWLVIDHMVLSLSKLTDPAKQKRNKKLCFPYLIQQVPKDDTEKLHLELNEELILLEEACEKFRKIRNKRVAHNDLVVALEHQSSPLPGVSREDVESALAHARNIMNKIERHFSKSQTFYDEIILPLSNDGRSVLIWLQKGLAYQQLENEGVVEKGMWKKIGKINS